MLLEFLKLGLHQIAAHKLRSFLTMLSIAIGAASIVAMTSLAQSGLATLTRGIEDVGGTRFIDIMTDAPKKAAAKGSNYARRLTRGDRDALAAAVPHLESIVGSIKFYNSRVVHGDHPEAITTVLATEPGYFTAYKMAVAKGRPLWQADVDGRRRVVVLGDKLARSLFGAAEAVGQELRFRGNRFEVVGVLGPNRKGDSLNLGYAWDEVAIIPVSAPGVGSELEEISLTVRHTEDGELAVRVANAVLMHRHHGVDNFQIFDFGGLLKNFYLAFAVMQAVVALIASIALLIGGVGVMNIMLVSVSERMREIGLRKALGASREMIHTQFLLESLVLSLVGAGVGVAAGLGLTRLGSTMIKTLAPAWIETFSPVAVAVALLASCAIGVFFGWYPATRAAEAEPIACLRHE
jgi:putative ABC transport system permease protein